MSSSPPTPPRSPSSRRRFRWPRFGLGGLLLLMLVVGVAASAAGYLQRGVRGGHRPSQLVFLLIVLAGPLLLLVLVSSLHALIGEARSPSRKARNAEYEARGNSDEPK